MECLMEYKVEHIELTRLCGLTIMKISLNIGLTND